MSNCSDCFVVLEGEKVKEAFKEIEKHIITYEGEKLKEGYLAPLEMMNEKRRNKLIKKNPVAAEIGYGGGELFELELEDDGIRVALSGKGCGPSEFFKDIAKEFKLSGFYTDNECGCDFFHKIIFEYGKVVHEKTSEYFSDESIAEYGIENFLEDFQWLPEDEDWIQEHAKTIALFGKYGYDLNKLKKEWGAE